MLENIAPGQSQMIMKTLAEQKDQNDVIGDIKEAIKLLLVRMQQYSCYRYCVERQRMVTNTQLLMRLFPSVTKHQIERERKHASCGQAGMPIEPRKYHRSKVTEAQINHFLDFIQFNGLVQDVSSGTRSVKL